MSADKYPSIFSRQMEAIVYVFLKKSGTKYIPRSRQVFQYKDFLSIVISLLFHIIKSPVKQSSLY